MSRVKVYFEGAQKGPRSKFSQLEARTAFANFARKLRLGIQPSFIPCGGRQSAFEDFCTAIEDPKDDAILLLLVDSEGPTRGKAAWIYLNERPEDNWDIPMEARAGSVHLMVQCMETWLIADPDALCRFYSNDGFLPQHLPKHADLENVPARDVLSALKKSTARSARKGPYTKAGHSWKLLANMDPIVVENKCTHAKLFFDHLRKVCGEQ